MTIDLISRSSAGSVLPIPTGQGNNQTSNNKIPKGVLSQIWAKLLPYFQEIPPKLEQMSPPTEKDPAEYSLKIMEKIYNDPWNYHTMINNNALFQDTFRKYTHCHYNSNALLTAFIGEKKAKEHSITYNSRTLYKYGVSKYNNARFEELKASIESSRGSVNHQNGHVYQVSLSAIGCNDFFFGGHVFLIEQLPKRKLTDEYRYVIHQSYISHYTLKSNQYLTNDGKPLSQDEMDNFLSDLKKIVTAKRWTRETAGAFKRCFHVDASEYIGKRFKSNDRSKAYINRVSWMYTKEFEYDPKDLEKNVTSLLKKKKKVKISKETKYSMLAHKLTALQQTGHRRDFLETMNKMYLLVHGKDSTFNFQTAYAELYRISQERKSHTMRYAFISTRKVNNNSESEIEYKKIVDNEKKHKMPSTLNEFLNQVGEDFRRVVNNKMEESPDTVESLVHAIAHFGKNINTSGNRWIDDDSKVLEFLQKRFKDLTKIVNDDKKNFVNMLKKQCGDELCNLPKELLYHNVDGKTDIAKRKELMRNYSELQSWYKNIMSTSQVQSDRIVPTWVKITALIGVVLFLGYLGDSDDEEQ